jgi:hypothetical protein
MRSSPKDDDRLTFAGLQRVMELRRRLDSTHALAAARHRLDQNRIANFAASVSCIS